LRTGQRTEKAPKGTPQVFFSLWMRINVYLFIILQAEIDAAAEMIDFFRFNTFFGKELLKYQPISEQPESTLNLMRYRDGIHQYFYNFSIFFLSFF
jgi:hypothetical protein